VEYQTSSSSELISPSKYPQNGFPAHKVDPPTTHPPEALLTFSPLATLEQLVFPLSALLAFLKIIKLATKCNSQIQSGLKLKVKFSEARRVPRPIEVGDRKRVFCEKTLWLIFFSLSPRSGVKLPTSIFKIKVEDLQLGALACRLEVSALDGDGEIRPNQLGLSVSLLWRIIMLSFFLRLRHFFFVRIFAHHIQT
jgi:hypothetical protein